MRDMQPILNEKESPKETIDRLMGEIDGLIQTIEDKSPYSAIKYWDLLFGERKRKHESLLAIAEKALETFANIENWNDHDYGSRIPEWYHDSKPWETAKFALEQIKKE